MITVFEIPGTHNLTGNTTPDPWYFQTAFDPTKFKWVGVDYPGDIYPFNTSVAAGVANLAAAVAANPGPFAIISDSQGAMVAGDAYKQFQSSPRIADLKAVVALGSPVRAEGHTFPGYPDPGGHGIAANDLLTNPPSYWWDFAVPGDIVTCCPDSAAGTVETSIFYVLMNEYNGNIFQLLWNEGWATAVAVMQLAYTILGAHSYANNTTFFPLNDGRTIKQITIDYINTLA